MRPKLATGAYYAVLFLGLGVHLPFWPVWLAAWGLGEAAIGSLLGAAVLVRVVGAAALPAFADRTGHRRAMLGFAGLAAAGLFAAHSFAGSFGMLLALTLAASLATAPLIPLGEAMGLRAATRYGFAYAPVRAAGSLSFLAAALGTGWLLDHVSPQILPWLLALSLLATALLGWTHPGGSAPLNLADRAPADAWRGLLRHPAFLVFALATALGQGAHAVYYAFSALIWQEAGLDAVTIGALWATGVAAEIWLMFGPGRSWLARLGPVRALALAALAGILRWGAMALGAEGWVLWPLQAMHALTFGLTHLAAMAFIAEAIPMRLAGTAQGLAAGLIGGSVMAGLILAAGQMAGEAAGPALYLLGALAAAASLGATLLLGKLWRGGAIA